MRGIARTSNESEGGGIAPFVWNDPQLNNINSRITELQMAMEQVKY